MRRSRCYASETNAINGTNPLVQCVTDLNGQCSMDVFGTGTRDVWVREGAAPVRGGSGSTRSAQEPRTTERQHDQPSVHGAGQHPEQPALHRAAVPAPERWRLRSAEIRQRAEQPTGDSEVRVEPGDGLRRLVVHQRFRDDRDEERGARVRHRPHRYAVADRDVLVRHASRPAGRSGQPPADAGRDRQRTRDELHQRPARQSQQREQPHQLGRGPLPGGAEHVALRRHAHAHRRQPNGLGADRRPCARRLRRSRGGRGRHRGGGRVRQCGEEQRDADLRGRHRPHESAGRQSHRDLGSGRRASPPASTTSATCWRRSRPVCATARSRSSKRRRPPARPSSRRPPTGRSRRAPPR